MSWLRPHPLALQLSDPFDDVSVRVLVLGISCLFDLPLLAVPALRGLLEHLSGSPLLSLSPGHAEAQQKGLTKKEEQKPGRGAGKQQRRVAGARGKAALKRTGDRGPTEEEEALRRGALLRAVRCKPFNRLLIQLLAEARFRTQDPHSSAQNSIRT